MFTIACIAMTAIAIFFLVKVPLAMMGFTPPLMRFVLPILVLISVPFAVTLDSRIQNQNAERVADWNAQRCVAPEVVAQSVFVAQDDAIHVGTAFLIEGGYVVTNQHVSESLDTPFFRSPNGTQYRGQLVYRADPEAGSDIAVYRLLEYGGQPELKLANASPAEGESILAVGNPGSRERFYASVLTVYETAPRGTVYEGDYTLPTRVLLTIPLAVSGLMSDDDGNPNVVETTANGDVSPGSSGSPVVNCQGEVVGVVFAGRGYFLHPSEQTARLVSLQGLNDELAVARRVYAAQNMSPPVSQPVS